MIHIGELILQKLNEKGETTSWLAEQLGCQRAEVARILESPSIETDCLIRISSVLEYNFFQEYSNILAKLKVNS